MSVERAARTVNGWADAHRRHRPLRRARPALFILAFMRGDDERERRAANRSWWLFIAGCVVLVRRPSSARTGFFTLQPNEARVLDPLRRLQGHEPRDRVSAGATRSSPNGTRRLERAAKGAGQIRGEARRTSRRTSRAPLGRYTVSRRIRNFEETEKLKVNDKRGNPIEIAAVVVWRVVDTAHALFDVDHYEHYVKIQSEPPALRTWPTATRHRPRRGRGQ